MCVAEAACVGEAVEILPGSLSCSKCDRAFCSEHGEAHTRKVKGQVMAASEGQYVAGAPCRCLIHADIPFTHYCVTDNTVLCALCVLKDHIGHEYVLLESGWCEARLLESAARVPPVAEAMMRGVTVALQTIAALGTAKDTAIKQFEAEMDALFVRLFAYGAGMVRRVEAVHDERVKALEAQAGELAVTSAQLRAAAAVAAQALALPQPSAALGVARAYSCVCAVEQLVGDCPAPAATAILRIECEPAPLLAALDALATLVTDNAREVAAQAAAAREEAARKDAEAKAAATTLLGSAILASVAPERLASFLRKLSAWLPCRTYTLLYRGSRDGMTAAAFHSLCDDKGPTLVLVRCDKGWVFGGHADASWENSPGCATYVGSGIAFLLSVTGPYTATPVRFPVKAENGGSAVHCYAGCGPMFTRGLWVRAGSDSPTASYDVGSNCQIGSGYEDSIGKGMDSLTGARDFTPNEVEVFVVTPA